MTVFHALSGKERAFPAVMLERLFMLRLDDVVQILILYFVIYGLIRFIKGTRSAQMLLGIGVVVMSSLFLIWLFDLDVLARIFYYLLGYLAIGIVIVFQHEIRRGLALIGGRRIFLATRVEEAWKGEVPEVLCRTALEMSRMKMGALIAVERGISLMSYEATGVRVDAIPSRELLISIFTPPLPLHDGGVIIRDGRIASAHCLFPLSTHSGVSTGMRHRSALGLSEETDAVILVVSEETGAVSIAYNGHINRYLPADNIPRMVLRWLRLAMPHVRPPHSLRSLIAFSFLNRWKKFKHQVEEYNDERR